MPCRYICLPEYIKTITTIIPKQIFNLYRLNGDRGAVVPSCQVLTLYLLALGINPYQRFILVGRIATIHFLAWPTSSNIYKFFCILQY
jgi:hypothetical protein